MFKYTGSSSFIKADPVSRLWFLPDIQELNSEITGLSVMQANTFGDMTKQSPDC